MTLDAHEFIRRFLLHSLPKGLRRIRHYGLFANAQRQTKLALIRRLLDQPAPAPACREGDYRLRLAASSSTSTPAAAAGSVRGHHQTNSP